MIEIESVIEYLKESPQTLEAGSLGNKDRTICYVLHNRLVYAINLHNPSYKTMADLTKESIIAVREMRDDIELMVSRNYNDVPIMENVLFSDVIAELGRTNLDNYQNCVSYLGDLAIASVATIKANAGMSTEVKLVFDTMIYLCVKTLNLINETLHLPPEQKGLEISFDRKRKPELQARRTGS